MYVCMYVCMYVFFVSKRDKINLIFIFQEALNFFFFFLIFNFIIDVFSCRENVGNGEKIVTSFRNISYSIVNVLPL